MFKIGARAASKIATPPDTDRRRELDGAPVTQRLNRDDPARRRRWKPRNRRPHRRRRDRRQAKGDKVTVFKKRLPPQLPAQEAPSPAAHDPRGSSPSATTRRRSRRRRRSPPTAPATEAPAKAAAPAKKDKAVAAITPEEGSGDIAGKPTLSTRRRRMKPRPILRSTREHDATSQPGASGKKSTGGGKTAKPASTKNAAPAKGAAKKSPKAK